MHPTIIKRLPVRVYEKYPYYVISKATATQKAKRVCIDHVKFDPLLQYGYIERRGCHVFNLWDGIVAEKLPAISDPAEEDELNNITLDFIWRTMMDTNVNHLEFFLDWMANPIIQPEKHTKVAVIFSGPKDGAHHIFLEFYRNEVLGDWCTYHTRNAKRDILRPTRQAHFVYSVLNQIDGIKGELTDDGVLRSAIDKSTINVDCMMGDSRPNIANFILTTDQDSDIVLKANDRRFVAYKVPPFTGDEAALRQHLDDPRTARAFYQLLKRRDVAKYGRCFQDGRALSDFYNSLVPAADTAVL